MRCASGSSASSRNRLASFERMKEGGTRQSKKAVCKFNTLLTYLYGLPPYAYQSFYSDGARQPEPHETYIPKYVHTRTQPYPARDGDAERK